MNGVDDHLIEDAGELHLESLDILLEHVASRPEFGPKAGAPRWLSFLLRPGNAGSNTAVDRILEHVQRRPSTPFDIGLVMTAFPRSERQRMR